MNKTKIIVIAFMIMLSGIGIVYANPGQNESLITSAEITPSPTPPPEIISINVSTHTVNFGKVGANESSLPQNVMIGNDGNVNVIVAITPSVLTGSNVSNTIPADSIASNPMSPTPSIDVGSSLDESFTLNVPIGTVPDTYTGGIELLASKT